MDAAIDSNLIEKVFYKLKLFIQPERGGEDDKIDLSDSISGMVILKRFNTQSLPIIRVIANVSVIEARNIQQNFNKGNAFMSLNYYVQDRADSESTPEDKFESAYSNIPLTIVGLDRNEINSEYSENPEDSSGEANMSQVSFPIELMPTSALKMNEQVSPQILSETDTLNIIGKLLSDNHVPKYKVCLAKPDLIRKYGSFNVTSKSVNQFVKYMQKVYGIYNSPLISFFDIDKYFLMASGKLAKFPTDVPLSAATCAEAHITFVTDSESQVMFTEGSYFDEELGVARCVSFIPPRINLADPAQTYLDGNHVKLMSGNYSERESHECFMQDLSSTNEETLVGKEKVIVSRFDNPTVAKQYQFESKENMAPAMIELNAADLKIFDPRKKFLFINSSDEQNLAKGYWRMNGLQLAFTGTGNTEDTILSLNIKATFKPFLAEV